MSRDERAKKIFNLVRNGKINIQELEELTPKIEIHELFLKRETGHSLYSYIIDQIDEQSNQVNGQTVLNRLFNENFKNRKTFFSLKAPKLTPEKLTGLPVLYWTAALRQTETLRDLIQHKQYDLTDLLKKDRLGVDTLDRINRLNDGKALLSLIFDQHFTSIGPKYSPDKLEAKKIGYWAFRLKQFDVIVNLIEQGQIKPSELFYRDEHHKSLLAHIRTFENSQKLLDSLFDRFFENKEIHPEKNKNTLLHWAVILGQHAKVKELLDEEKYTIDIKGNEGLTPLHFATQSGDKEMIELLLQYKPNVNAESNNGVTPLFSAVRSGNTAIAQLLTSVEAKESKFKEFKRTQSYNPPSAASRDNLMMLAAKLGHHNMIEILAPISDVNYVSPRGAGLNPALNAIMRNQPETLKELIQHGAQLDYRTQSNGMSLWLVAAVFGNEAICAILKDHNVPADIALTQEIDTWNLPKGSTPLHAAVKFNNLHAAKILVADMNISTETQDANAQTPFDLTVQTRYKEMIQTVLKLGNTQTNTVDIKNRLENLSQNGTQPEPVVSESEDDISNKNLDNSSMDDSKQVKEGPLSNKPDSLIANFAELSKSDEEDALNIDDPSNTIELTALSSQS